MKSYTHLIFEKLKEFSEKHEDFSIGAILYMAMDVKHKGVQFTRGSLYSTSDEEMYGILSKALIEANREKLEEEENN